LDQESIFALDIGTRKIVGVVMQKKTDGYEILGSAMLEHTTRAMVDGQIHDVEAVASTIEKIKHILEERLQLELKQAAVAAAGRSLLTAVGKAARRISIMSEINQAEVSALEIEAVHFAQNHLTRAEESNNYFCVGYSVVKYLLEGQHMASLVGQRGEEIGVEIIATFLPRVVVDSLFSALNRAGLEASNLTLEPIAALSVAIPPEMRMLNLVLVDVGAGTSDLAIVNNGSITAYAMVPCAGDEITECIASEYLLDFYTAESLKRQLSGGEELKSADILGNMLTIPVMEIIEKINPVLKDITDSIANQVLELNMKKPDAVVCVGGGSLTPGFTEELAEKLSIASRRVGLRTPAQFRQIEVGDEYLLGPQGVTPLGIAYHALSHPPAPLVKVRVNDRELALWNAGEFTVATALLSSGLNLGNIYGKPGLGKTVEINGAVKTIKGEIGQPPVIKVNGQDASLDALIRDGDQIEFHRGRSGRDAKLLVSDLLEDLSTQVMVNGQEVQVTARVTVNGQPAAGEEEIPDRAVVQFQPAGRLENILQQCGIPEHRLAESIYYCYLNEEKKELKWKPLEVKVNGQEAQMNQDLPRGAEIIYTMKHEIPMIKDFIGESGSYDIRVTVNKEVITIRKEGAAILMDGQPVTLEDRIKQGATLSMVKSRNGAILSDIFQVVNIKPSLQQQRLLIRVDGRDAGYTTPIFENSEIEITWEQ
jgi:cell division protein FtsA